MGGYSFLFIQVLLNLYAKFQPSTMSGSGQKVCGGGGGWVLNKILQSFRSKVFGHGPPGVRTVFYTSLTVNVDTTLSSKCSSRHPNEIKTLEFFIFSLKAHKCELRGICLFQPPTTLPVARSSQVRPSGPPSIHNR